MSITPTMMTDFVQKAADILTGDWVIIGGSVLHLLNIAGRQTEDIDLAGPDNSPQTETIKLMEIAESFGLPIEAINQAGAFFLRKISDWDQKLIKVHQGRSATFYRPNSELFFELKIARLTEADATDCVRYPDYTIANKEPFKPEILFRICTQKSGDISKSTQLKMIIDAIKSKSLTT